MQNSVAPGSQTQYNVGWRTWESFAKSFNFDAQLQRSLPRASSNYDFRVEAIIAFISFLFHEKRLQSDTICNYIAGIIYIFRCQGLDVSPFTSSPVLMAKSGITLLCRRRVAQADRGTLPFTWDMIMKYQEMFPSSITRNHAMFTALALAYILLLRVSEYVVTPANHFLRSQDVQFCCQDGTIIASHDHATLRACHDSITHVVFVIRSAKNDKLGRQHRLCFRRSDADSKACICTIAYNWAVRAQLSRDAQFLSYQTQWCVTSSDVNRAVKSVARAFRLDCRRFTSHSLRYGGASALAAGGVADSAIQNTGRWSSTAFLGYLRLSTEIMDRSLRVLCDTNVFSVSDVRRLTSSIIN